MRVLHVLPCNGNNVNKNLARKLCVAFPDSLFALRLLDSRDISATRIADNQEWIEYVGEERFVGVLRVSTFLDKSCHYFGSRIASRICAVRRLLLPELTIGSLLKIVLGPRNILVHRNPFSFPTMVVLKLFFKKVVLIHWGGSPHVYINQSGLLTSAFDVLAFRVQYHVFVLMTPEVDAFKKIGVQRVSVLPYPSSPQQGVLNIVEDYWAKSCPRRILLGNNTLRRDLYPEILDKLHGEDWDEIVCMLNYGNEDDEARTEVFIEKYKKRFGEKFKAWRTVLPMDEYRKYVARFPFYICPAPRQSGLAAAYSSVFQGKVLFLRGDNLKWLNEVTNNGANIVDLDTVKDFSFKSFCAYLSTRECAIKSARALRDAFKERYTIQHWKSRIEETFNGA